MGNKHSNYVNTTPGHVDQLCCNPTAPPFNGQSHLLGQCPGQQQQGPLRGPFGRQLGGPYPGRQPGQFGGPFGGPFGSPLPGLLRGPLGGPCPAPYQDPLQQQLELLQSMDPAVTIANSTLANRVVWTQPEPIPVDPAAAAETVHNHYYGPVVNKNERRECVNCCEDCCEDVCENVCLDWSRLIDRSSIVIGSLLQRELQKDLNPKQGSDSELLKK